MASRSWSTAPTITTRLPANAALYALAPPRAGNRGRPRLEEIFGPVLAITPYRDDADAVSLANESAFGVGGSVWTNDLERGIGVARRVQTGTVGISGYIPEPTAPFRGYKGSGIGREFGPEALAGYMQYQSVHLPAMV